MKLYQIEVKASARKQIQALPKQMQDRVGKAIDELALDPRPRGCKKVSGAGSDRYRIRVGRFRVIYRVFDDRLVVLIVKVAHRKEAYRNLAGGASWLN